MKIIKPEFIAEDNLSISIAGVGDVITYTPLEIRIKTEIHFIVNMNFDFLGRSYYKDPTKEAKDYCYSIILSITGEKGQKLIIKDNKILFDSAMDLDVFDDYELGLEPIYCEIYPPITCND